MSFASPYFVLFQGVHSSCPVLVSSLAKVTAAASTCFVPDLRSVLVTCFKSLFPLWVVSQLFTKSAPLESECLEESIEIVPMAETTEEEVTVVTVEKWPGRGGGSSGKWPTGRTLVEMSSLMMLVCWMMWRMCCCRQRPEGERSPIHAIRKRVNSSPGRLVVNLAN